MSIYSEINRLQIAKENLKLKLEQKGVVVPENARINDYAALINLLPEIKESEFVNRIVDNGNSGTGKAKIYNIKGRSLVWNQLVEDNVIHQTGTLSSDVNTATNLQGKVSLISGHKYLLSARGTGVTRIRFRDVTAGINPSISDGQVIIYTATVSSTNTTFVQVFGAASAAYDIYLNVFDLTLKFGAGNEPITIEEFESKFPLSYYEYNAGTLINNDAEAIESIGFNQWDEEWEVGAYDRYGEKAETDGFIPENSTIRCKNLIRVFPGNYYATAHMIVQFYNEGGNYMAGRSEYNYSGFALNVNSGNFTIPQGVAYIAFRTSTAYGTTYNNDICINLSNPAKNGTYEPYKKFTLPLGLNSFRVKDDENNIITINGLKSAGDVYDEIVGNKYIKRIGSVDLGNLEWSLGSMAGLFLTQISGQRIVSVGTKPNAICSKYEVKTTIASSTNAENGCIYQGNANYYIFFRDNNYASYTSEQVAVALSGVYLYYELATPIEYELVDEIDTIYDVDKDGVERIISPVHVDGSPSAPFRASIGYPVNQE